MTKNKENEMDEKELKVFVTLLNTLIDERVKLLLEQHEIQDLESNYMQQDLFEHDFDDDVIPF